MSQITEGKIMQTLEACDMDYKLARITLIGLKGIAVSERHPNITQALDIAIEVLSHYEDMRNELCVKCGNYKESHLGACDGCRWENV